LKAFLKQLWITAYLALGLVIFIGVSPRNLFGQEPHCDDTLGKLGSPKPVRPAQELAELLSKNPIEKNPFLEAGLDGNAIGRIQHQLGEQVPEYDAIRLLEGKAELTPIEWERFDGVVKSATSRLKDPKLTELQKLAIHELATRANNLELRRPISEEDKDQRHISEQPKEDPSDKPNQPKKPKGSPPNPWTDPPKEYVPHNKRLEAGEGDSEVLELLRTDAETLLNFYPSNYYDEFSAIKVRENPKIREEVRTSADPQSHKKMLVSTHGKGDVVLLLPYGYQPIATEPLAQLQKDSLGRFHLLNSKGHEPISVTLAPIEGIVKRPELQHYLTPSGLKLEEWPSEIQNFVRLLASSTENAVEKAKKIKSFIRQYYKYYSEGQETSKEELDAADKIAAQHCDKPNIIQMAFSKMLNCDGDSLTAGIWLRDYLKVPVRLVGGKTLTGIDNVDGVPWEVITSQSVPHMWLEVWDGNRWVPFDMQPPHTPKSDGKEDSQRLAKKPMEEEDSQHKNDRKEGKEGKEGHEKKESKNGQPADPKERAPLKDMEQYQFEELQKEANPVYALLLRAFKLQALERGLDRGHLASANEILDQVKGMGNEDFVLSTLAKSVGEYTDRILATHKLPGSLHERFQNIKHQASQKDFTSMFTELQQIKAELIELEKLRPLKPPEKELAHEIHRILTSLRANAGKEGEDRAVLEELLKTLPGNLSRRMLLDEIGADETIDGASLKKFSGLWSDSSKSRYYRQLVAASEFVDTFLNGRPEPVYRMQKTDERNPVLTQRRDVDYANRVSQIPRFIWDLKPGEHPLQPFIEGKQLAIQSRVEKPVISPRLPLVRKHTEVLVDVSGSMGGEKAEAMTALLGAFIDRCLSEKDAMGLPLNTLSITYFGDGVRSDSTVKLMGEELEKKALDQLRIFRRSTINANGTSTALFDAIHHSIEGLKQVYLDPGMNSKLKRKVGRGNIAVFTDGDDNSSKRRISDINALLGTLPAQMELNLKVYGLGMSGNPVGGIEVPVPKHKQREFEEHPERFQLTQEIKYEELNEIVQAPFELEKSGKNEVVVDEAVVDPKIKEKISKMKSPGVFESSLDVLPLLKAKAPGNQKPRSIETMDSGQREAASTLVQITKGLINAKGLSLGLRAKIALSLENHYPEMTGRSFGELQPFEQESIDYLKRWARGEF